MDKIINKKSNVEFINELKNKMTKSMKKSFYSFNVKTKKFNMQNCR